MLANRMMRSGSLPGWRPWTSAKRSWVLRAGAGTGGQQMAIAGSDDALDDDEGTDRAGQPAGQLRVERVVMEATSSYWKRVFYLLEAHGLDPWLVNARDVKHLPGRPKTDVLDAVWLCKVAERQMTSRSSRRMILAAAGFRQLRHHVNLPRPRDRRDLPGHLGAQLLDHLLARNVGVVFQQDDERADRLAGGVVAGADNCRLGHPGVADQSRLHLRGGDTVSRHVHHTADDAARLCRCITGGGESPGDGG